MRLVLPRLYVILDASLIVSGELDKARTLAECGVRLVQYRGKNQSSGQQLRMASQLAKFFERRGVTFLVNDRPDIALLAGAAGVHVGQEDLSVEDARKVLGPGKWVGVSTHSLEQVRRAAESTADYIAVGPIFPTTTKANPDAVVGTALIREARGVTEKPVVAIGGITLETAPQALAAGADSLVVISDIWRAPDPRARIEQYQKLLAAGAEDRIQHQTTGKETLEAG
ncbi:MAG TPA: thiamine phosphate synthase [Candidatus Acidoferrales bacterium]|nr:thiamine phosphate synthase [Candidatus Acidoferrales bacterium]